jgi:hypothetical protein
MNSSKTPDFRQDSGTDVSFKKVRVGKKSDQKDTQGDYTSSWWFCGTT